MPDRGLGLEHPVDEHDRPRLLLERAPDVALPRRSADLRVDERGRLARGQRRPEEDDHLAHSSSERRRPGTITFTTVRPRSGGERVKAAACRWPAEASRESSAAGLAAFAGTGSAAMPRSAVAPLPQRPDLLRVGGGDVLARAVDVGEPALRRLEQRGGERAIPPTRAGVARRERHRAVLLVEQERARDREPELAAPAGSEVEQRDVKAAARDLLDERPGRDERPQRRRAELALRDRRPGEAARERPPELVALADLEQRVEQRRARVRVGGEPVRAPRDRGRPEERRPRRRAVHRPRRHPDLARPVQRRSRDPRRAHVPAPRHALEADPGRAERVGAPDLVAGVAARELGQAPPLRAARRLLRGPELGRLGERRRERRLERQAFAVRDLEHVPLRADRARDLDPGAIEAGHAREPGDADPLADRVERLEEGGPHPARVKRPMSGT